MMAYDVTCPNGHHVRVEAEHAGLRSRCPRCGAVFTVPASPADPFAAATLPRPAPPAAPPATNAESATAFVARPAPPPGAVPTVGGSPELRSAGYGMTLVGFLLVLVGRGCDNLSVLSITSANARYELAQVNFELEWEQRMRGAEPDERRELEDDKREERASLEKGAWLNLQAAARKAPYQATRWAWWFEAVFLLGTMGLVSGLGIVSVAASGPERWACLVMLGIITVSVYIGGVAWIKALLLPLAGLR